MSKLISASFGHRIANWQRSRLRAPRHRHDTRIFYLEKIRRYFLKNALLRDDHGSGGVNHGPDAIGKRVEIPEKYIPTEVAKTKESSARHDRLNEIGAIAHDPCRFHTGKIFRHFFQGLVIGDNDRRSLIRPRNHRVRRIGELVDIIE